MQIILLNNINTYTINYDAPIDGTEMSEWDRLNLSRLVSNCFQHLAAARDLLTD